MGTGVQEMAQTFDSSSTQKLYVIHTMTVLLRQAVREQKKTDKDGNTVLGYNADKEWHSGYISADKLSTGETYTVTAGDNSR